MTFDHGETSGMVGSKAVERDETRQSHAEYPALFEPAETNDSIHNGQLKRHIQHFSHHHPLSFNEITEKHENLGCNACKMGIRGPAYVCENFESDQYCLHQTCAELSLDMQHPLHSQHPLKLLTRCPTNQGRFICDECGDISEGFVYFCWECGFKLDLKCAALTTSEYDGQRLNQTKRESKKFHFSHEHMLVLTNCRPYVEKLNCNGCNQPIIDAAYCCLACSCILHESSLGLPQKMELQFHPEHPLVAKLTQFFEILKCCHACGSGFKWTNIRYNCSECSLDLHFSCANSLKWPLKHRSHIHNLYKNGAESQMLFENENISFSCNTCSKICIGLSYRCLECAINFHLECLPIPQFVKSVCHIHPFTLIDSFVEDDSGEYYCDVCVEERHAKDHVYFCEECHGLFLAHIECVLAKFLDPSYICFPLQLVK